MTDTMTLDFYCECPSSSSDGDGFCIACPGAKLNAAFQAENDTVYAWCQSNNVTYDDEWRWNTPDLLRYIAEQTTTTKGLRRGPHGKFTQAELGGVHLVLCDNAEYLLRDRDHWEDKYQYEFDKSELAEYVSGWQDAVIRHLEARGIDADHVTVEYRDGGIDHWNGYRNSSGGVHVAVGLVVVLPEWEIEPPHYGPEREPLMRAMAHAACDAHDEITKRIERDLLELDLYFHVGQAAAEAIGKFLQGVNV